MDEIEISVRFGSYAVLSLLAGIPLFLWISLGPQAGAEVFTGWKKAHAKLLILGAVLTIVSLISTTARMSGMALSELDGATLRLILFDTPLGKAACARTGLLILTIIALSRAPRGTVAIPAILTGLAAATLAWSGHGASTEGLLGWVHLTGDALHIVTAALWIGGMACLLRTLAGGGDIAPDRSVKMLRQFAWIGTGIVAILIVTGILNVLLTIGASNLMTSFAAPYGRLLALKLLLFAAMLALAANNRFRLTPRFEAGKNASALRRSIALEISLGIAILALVAGFGTLDPLGG